MRLVKLALISAVGLFVVIWLLSLLIPSHSIVSRAVTINAPIDSVRQQIRDMRHWEQWNALLKDSSLGKIKFQADVVQANNMTITLLNANDTTIVTSWKRTGQEPVTGTFSLNAVENATVLQWYFDFHLKWYPWEKFGSIVFDKELGPPMEASLDQLKKISQKTPD